MKSWCPRPPPITNPQSPLFNWRQLYSFSCSGQILESTLTSLTVLCSIANPSANPVGCFLKNISVFPASFDRMNGSPWLELDHPLHLQGHNFTIHIHVEKIRTYLFWPWYLLSPEASQDSLESPQSWNTRPHVTYALAFLTLSGSLFQPWPTMSSGTFGQRSAKCPASSTSSLAVPFITVL